MNRKSVQWIVLALGSVATAAVLAVGAASPSSDASSPMQGGMMKDGQDMGGLMQMMRSCHGMTGGNTMGGMGAMGGMHLPKGNEKLEAQMHAEMMQKMGEIAGKYAERAN